MNNNTTLGQDVWMLSDNEYITLITKCKCGCSYSESVDSMEFMLHTKALKSFHYEYNEDKLVLTEEVSVCNKCTANSIHAYKLTAPTGFSDVLLYHGLAAFGKDLDMNRTLRRVERLHEEHLIDICCCTTACIGPFGITLTGDVLAASNSDLFSYRDGDRIMIETKYSDRLVNSFDQLMQTDVGYDEIIATNIKIKGFWIKKEAMSVHHELVKKLASKYDVELIIV